MQRRVTRALRMIFVSNGRTEQRHDAVACVLVDRPFEAVDALGEDREEAVHDPVPFLRVDLFGEIHRALHVGEENRDLLTLAFEGTAGGEDLFGEVLWSVRAGGARGRRDTGGKSGASLCMRPYVDLALHDGDALDLHQLLAELNERLRIERELSAQGAQGYAPMALEKPACALNCLEEAHVRLTIVGMRPLAFSSSSRPDTRHDRGPHPVHPCRARRRTSRAARARTWRGTSAASASTYGRPTRH